MKNVVLLKKKMTDNIDVATLRGVSGAGPQKTLGTTIPSFPDTKTIVYEGIPSQATWGMVSRVMMPGGSTLQRANFFPPSGVGWSCVLTVDWTLR